jgi:carbonic anhydrase/acetyltransferase-like protein (isoleucine patch superfamily)
MNREPIGSGIVKRVLQEIAKVAPGARSVRPRLHKARGVNIGNDVWIGYDSILETSQPELITIEDGASIGIRVTIVAHFREQSGVRIEQDAFIGPGVVILPGVVIGRGAVVTAGSVVSRSIPPMTVAQGNPAVPVAQCGVALTPDVTMKEFSRKLRPIRRKRVARGAEPS